MDNIIQKFYSSGKNTQNYSHLGAFSSGMIINKNPISSHKNTTISDLKPINKMNNRNTINNLNGINSSNYTNNIKTFTLQRNTKMTQQEFLKPKKLIFNSSSDMLYHNSFRFNPRGELSLLKENISYQNKKNATKIQMIEEKMKHLELKNQRLESN